MHSSDGSPSASLRPMINEAIKFYRAGQLQQSHECLREILRREPAYRDALLWLAKVSSDPQEAIAAVELVLKLDPQNEIAQRALVSVKQRAEELSPPLKDQANLSLAVALNTGMTMTQARAVNWPLRGINRPIGSALDEGVISFRDLWWAIERAYDPRVQNAAKTILLSHLIGVEPKKHPLPLKVVIGSHYSEKQERISVLFVGLMIGVASTLASVLLFAVIIANVLNYGYGQRISVWFNLLIWLAIGLIWLVSVLTNRYFDQLDQYRLGRLGEEKVTEQLRASLSGEWAVFRNFEWSHRHWGDVDLILVGPGGIWAFEVKAYSSVVRNIGDRWERKNRWGWRKLTTHPGQQARRNAARLKEFLESHQIKVGWVQPIVIWAGEQNLFDVQEPATPVWNLPELSDHAEELWQSRNLSKELLQKVLEVLGQAVREMDKPDI